MDGDPHRQAVVSHKWEADGRMLRTEYVMGDRERCGWFVAECHDAETATIIADMHNAALAAVRAPAKGDA